MPLTAWKSLSDETQSIWDQIDPTEKAKILAAARDETKKLKRRVNFTDQTTMEDTIEANTHSMHQRQALFVSQKHGQIFLYLQRNYTYQIGWICKIHKHITQTQVFWAKQMLLCFHKTKACQANILCYTNILGLHTSIVHYTFLPCNDKSVPVCNQDSSLHKFPCYPMLLLFCTSILMIQKFRIIVQIYV